ncbi:glycoside hydrolase family 32 protein [Clostridium grantii]|uniref:Fructan beta-fructosidase n=1 Tax=Clostridium grantii DSM 8605 TaxID=1121316 RepID=A0A1M5RQM6_9CLOT|nr:glycoside hydrolase family 32 protein [Clostridium grantii]SHH28438.1 fructan beta-fructosidase [Clostridium grantii DSM 8605]
MGEIIIEKINANDVAIDYKEEYRGQFHYSPLKNWMNDPNGLIYYLGEYHMFYQYYPHDTVWGPMHWGHAVSKDLIRWEELPIALAPDKNGMIFSGSAVWDKDNTSGLFDDVGEGIVAIFTHADNKVVPGMDQAQSIAYSKDKGRTWTMYENNPVLLPTNTTDFRDPKVFWHEETCKWIMPLAVQDRVEIYTSPNLINWTFASSFGAEEKYIHRGVFECPDLVQVPVKGYEEKKKWVLMLSVGDNNGVNKKDYETPAGGSGMLYFIGDFDGITFTKDDKAMNKEEILWVDYGADFYAAVTWSNVKVEEKPIWIAWMSNWRYARETPTTNWKSSMSIPRTIELINTKKGLRLSQQPIQQLSTLKESIFKGEDIEIEAGTDILTGIQGESLEIVARFEVKDAIEFGFKVLKTKESETVIGYKSRENKLFLDRRNSGNTSFDPAFPAVHEVELMEEYNEIELKIFVDASLIEVFGNDGMYVISDQVFPNWGKEKSVEVFSKNGSVKLRSLEIFRMNSSWNQ